MVIKYSLHWVTLFRTNGSLNLLFVFKVNSTIFCDLVFFLDFVRRKINEDVLNWNLDKKITRPFHILTIRSSTMTDINMGMGKESYSQLLLRKLLKYPDSIFRKFDHPISLYTIIHNQFLLTTSRYLKIYYVSLYEYRIKDKIKTLNFKMVEFLKCGHVQTTWT